MKRNFKKILTLGLAIVMTLSFSILAFARGDGYCDVPLGDSYMWGHLVVDGSDARASISVGVTSDLRIDGSAKYYWAWDDEVHWTSLSGGTDQYTDYGTSAHRDASWFEYAAVDFSAGSNDGAYNKVYVNCLDIE